MILYINDFVSRREILHVLKKSEGLYKRTPVYSGEEAYYDDDIRVSETAVLEMDRTLRGIRQRARKLQGWRGKSHIIEPLKVQRYGVNGFFNFHWDWDTHVEEGNRVATFMIFLEANCTGGGTNFPDLPMPKDDRWCDVIECGSSDDQNVYKGVTFKPIQGAAVFWENTHVNGSLNTLVRHAGLPVASGQKVGLNIWTWDSAWRPPANGPKSAP